MTEMLVLYLCAAVLGAVLGASVGLSNRRRSAWPLVTAGFAIIGLWRLTIYAPEATTELTALNSIAAITKGIALVVIVFAATAAGWKTANAQH